MSALTDARRREEAHDEAVKRGRAKATQVLEVLKHFSEGLSASESAARLGWHVVTVKVWRARLDLGRWVDAVERVERGS